MFWVTPFGVAGPRSCWRTRKTRRREVSCCIPAVLRYSCALGPDLSEGATSLSERCLGQSQYIDCPIKWSLVKNSYGVGRISLQCSLFEGNDDRIDAVHRRENHSLKSGISIWGRSNRSLSISIGKAMHDLNEIRPSPVLGGRTAREVFEDSTRALPTRWIFYQEVVKTEAAMKKAARSRKEVVAARRQAVEAVLSSHGLFEEIADVTTNLSAENVTN